jgi:hypothetical protein
MTSSSYEKIADRVVSGLVPGIVAEGTRENLRRWVMDILADELSPKPPAAPKSQVWQTPPLKPGETPRSGPIPYYQNDSDG